jgi:hypothetical protein
MFWLDKDSMMDIKLSLTQCHFARALCALAASCSMPLLAYAQQADSVANAGAKVPSVEYRSVFKETSLGVEKETVDWRKANNDVGRFLRGHIDILKEEEMEEGKKMAKPTQASQPTKAPATPPAQARTPATAPAPAPATAPAPAPAPAHKH